MIDLARTHEGLFEMPPLTWTLVDGVPIMRDSCEGEVRPSIPGNPQINDSATWTDFLPHHSRLDAWSITENGTVSPSVHYLDCGWHDHVRLVGWERRNWVRIQVELHQEVLDAIKRIAEEHGITMTEALQRAINTERASHDERERDID